MMPQELHYSCIYGKQMLTQLYYAPIFLLLLDVYTEMVGFSAVIGVVE
jgi:hypothetical protein